MPALDLTFNTDGGGFDDAGRLTPRSRGGRLDSPRADIVEKCSGRGVLSPKYYTGHVPSWQHEESDALETPLAKECVVGYQGHLHGMRNTFGQTFRDARHDTDLRASGLGEAEHIHRNMLEARATPPGKYIVTPATFEPGQEGDFSVLIGSSLPVTAGASPDDILAAHYAANPHVAAQQSKLSPVLVILTFSFSSSAFRIADCRIACGSSSSSSSWKFSSPLPPPPSASASISARRV